MGASVSLLIYSTDAIQEGWMSLESYSLLGDLLTQRLPEIHLRNALTPATANCRNQYGKKNVRLNAYRKNIYPLGSVFPNCRAVQLNKQRYALSQPTLSSNGI